MRLGPNAIGPDLGTSRPEGRAAGGRWPGASLDDLAAQVHAQGVSPVPRSGRQERLENILNRFV